MTIAKKILTAKKHHNLAVRHCRMKFAKALPRIFIQKPDARIISCTAPSFNKFISDFIKHRTGRKHICRSHTCCVK